MSKFIKVTLHGTDLSSLIAVGEITSIGREGVYTKDGFVKVNETIEQIESQLLRDEFAMRSMQAIQNAIIIPDGMRRYDQAAYGSEIAEDAYRMADAMLRERNK